MRQRRILNIFLAMTMALGTVVPALGNPSSEQETVDAVPSEGVVTTTAAALTITSDSIVADWKFNTEGIASGSIEEGTLLIEDQSNNNNQLRMQLYNNKQVTGDNQAANWSEYLYFTEQSMMGTGGSLTFNGDNSQGIGADFITVDDAPINEETFEEGYTMEFLYYFPEDWTDADKWMGLMARQVSDVNNVQSMDEPELGSMSVAISNCKEIQYLTAPANDNHEMSNAAWSVSMDKGGVWYHIAIVSDGSEISTYVNGCEAFRDYVSSDMKGLFADPEDGRFRIGSSWWLEGGQTLDKFLKGNIEQIRISKGALDREEWLITDPETYIGEYGSNEAYALKNEENYNFVLIPDTQNMVKFAPEVIDTAIEELIDTADQLNVKGVIHLGDVVEDSNDPAQYITAREIFYKLPDAGVKFLVQPGNHDAWETTSPNYWNTFGADSPVYMNKTASYLTAYAWSGYMLVDAGSYQYLLISLACQGAGRTTFADDERDWVISVLEQYPDCPTIITTHDIQNCSDTEPSAIKLSKQGEKLWDFVKDYNQVFMMVGGHSHGAGVEILHNSSGNEVISILTDYQFAYNGGNGIFRYLEFDEAADKIYYSAYSPYAASLEEEEKTFFDVNFLTGEGNEGEIDFNFTSRLEGMEKVKQEPATEGKWMGGEYHLHTTQSNDASASFMTQENVLNVAFRTDMETLPEDARVENIQYGDAFDYVMLADHLRYSPRLPDGTVKETARYIAIANQIREIEKLRGRNKFLDKIIYSGFEWDMPGLDHATVAIIDGEQGVVNVEAIHEFEWLYADQKNNSDSLYTHSGINETEVYGERIATIANNERSNIENTYLGIEWLKENYPESFVLPNHPSRHNGESGEVRIEHLRSMNDISEEIVFGFEGIPGNQLDPSAELPEESLRAGADEMIAVTGGIWDALLSEGRRFYNFANSDFHFKISSGNAYSSGYWPTEFSRNYTWVEPGDDQEFTFYDVVNGMRSGNSYSVTGDLITDLEFTLATNDQVATMGQDLNVVEETPITMTIRFKVPEHNNYATLFGTETGIEASNIPDLDHIDVISGTVTGKVIQEDYDKTNNTDATIIKTFTKAEIMAAKGTDGYYTLTFETIAGEDSYFRIRGTSTDEVDENGDPVTHEREVTSTRPERFDYINDYNYTHLSFYANPIWLVTTEKEEPEVHTYELRFVTNSQDEIQSIQAVEGTVISLEKYMPTKEGYKFTGWYLDEALTSKVNEIILNKNEVIYAGWVIEEEIEDEVEETILYELSFVTNSQEVMQAIKAIEGSVIQLSQYTPIKNGYRFKGWYIDEALTIQVTEVTLTENKVVYAGWIVEESSSDDEDSSDQEAENNQVGGGGSQEPDTTTQGNNQNQEETSEETADLGGTIAVNINALKDVVGHWAQDAIYYVVKNRVMVGIDEETFAPNLQVTRGMMATILHRIAGMPSESSMSFKDVGENKYYYEAIAWASQNGIVSGYSQDQFAPDEMMTREQLAVMMYRYAMQNEDSVNSQADLTLFVDADDISSYAVEAFGWAYAKGIISGRGNGLLAPKELATRAEVAAIVYKFLNQ